MTEEQMSEASMQRRALHHAVAYQIAGTLALRLA